MAAASCTQSFAARPEALAGLQAFVDGWAAALDGCREAALHLRLAAEELFVNAVLHGYAGAPGEIRVTLAERAAELELSMEDDARAFDPFAAVAPVAASAVAAERPVGKLGLPILVQISSRRGYERRDGRNCVMLAIPKRWPAGRADP